MYDVHTSNILQEIRQNHWTMKYRSQWPTFILGERGGSVVECRTPEREVRGSKPTAAVLCPWARHFTPRKYWLITQEAVAPSRHDWKIVDWDVKPQHKQTNKHLFWGHTDSKSQNMMCRGTVAHPSGMRQSRVRSSRPAKHSFTETWSWKNYLYWRIKGH